MADRRRDTRRVQSHGETSHSVNGHGTWGDYHRTSPLALTAAAQVLPHSDHRYGTTALQYASWQEEAWSFYENLGELNYGIEWFSEALSRVRLNVAELTPGGDEPNPLDKGPAVDLIESLAGGADAQGQLMRSFATQLSVVGEGFFVGREVTDAELYGDTVLDAEPDEDGRVWTVQPVNTLRRSQRTLKTLLGRKRRGWELQTDEVTWLPLPAESLVTRVWHRNEHFPWLAASPTRSTLPVMREIDMYNRYIMATLISRVALNGMLLIPDEVTLPVNPEYEEEADPFIAELLDIMRSTIKNPGSAASAAPLPLRVPAEMVDKFKHLTFATPLDEKIFQSREEAIKRLAASLNLPMEVILGMGQTNHWSSWQLEESAIKIHITPTVEVITRCLSKGWLYPMLRAAGEDIRTKDGSLIVVWYDTSTLTQRPDRSELALQLRDRLIINDSATLRETGFSEDDRPTDEELERMALSALATNPTTFTVALKELTGLELSPPPQGAPGSDMLSGNSPPERGPDGGELPGINVTTRQSPATRDEPPPPPDEGIDAATRRGQLVQRVRDTVTTTAQR